MQDKKIREEVGSSRTTSAGQSIRSFVFLSPIFLSYLRCYGRLTAASELDKPMTNDPPTNNQPPKDQSRLIAFIMVAVVVWGALLATGAYLAKRDLRLPAIVMGCVATFLLFWWAMLAARRRRERD